MKKTFSLFFCIVVVYSISQNPHRCEIVVGFCRSCLLRIVQKMVFVHEF